jgi:phosphate transport system ATP-binding protein
MSDVVIKTRGLNFYYGKFQALVNIELEILRNRITAIIGPSGCGKSTLLRCFNRMNDDIKGARICGEVLFEGRNIYEQDVDLVALRKKIGMVFQRPNPFPLTIYENIAFGVKIHKIAQKKADIDIIVEQSLSATGLWEQVKDRLFASALSLSPEQQQRLCISRSIAVKSEVLLMDEPCSALDPISTMKIEELFLRLKKDYTIIVVTHNMQQAARISDYTGFILLGKLIEFSDTKTIFINPKDEKTRAYITGRYG